MKQIVTIAILGSLVLLGGCASNPTDIPNVIGYQGYLDLGWEKYNDEIFITDEGTGALDYFLDAIDIDPSRPEAYIGAGWSSLYLPDYWRIADDYFFMAIQNQIGYYPLSGYSESQVQDTIWTTFQCVDPVLPDSVLDVIEALGETWFDWPEAGDTTLIDQVTIGKYLYGAYPYNNFGPEYGDRDFSYRFMPLNEGVLAMFQAVNSYTTYECDVDSIAGGWVYITVPLAEMDIGGDTYYTWISVDEQVNYSYRVFYQTGAADGQLFWDALAGCCMLQDIRDENGDPLLCNAAAWTLDMQDSEYIFGDGQIYEGYEVVTNLQLKGTAAAMAFSNQYFKFAWFTCISEGLGLEYLPGDPDFVTGLMAVIEFMLDN